MEAAVAIRSVRVSGVIPAMNEAENLPHVFPRLPDGLHEVIIVDGRSNLHAVRDGSRVLRTIALRMSDFGAKLT